MRRFLLAINTPIKGLAAFSVLALLAVAGVQLFSAFHTQSTSEVDANAPRGNRSSDALLEQEKILLGMDTRTDPAATSTEDEISLIGPMVMAEISGQYAGLSETGNVNTDSINKVAETIAPNVRARVSYKTYELSDLSTDADTSRERMLTYRNDLRVALEPLLQNSSSEFEIYGRYVETSDPQYLEQLTKASANYQKAAAQAAAIRVPRDAVNYHLAILNAMEQFAATLDSLAAHGTDPFASVALLRTYNEAEQKVLLSFNNLTGYYSQKL